MVTTAESGDSQLEVAFAAALENRENLNIPFIWDGPDADPNTDETLHRAFELAQREDLLAFVPVGLYGEYYITDEKLDFGSDSRLLHYKYPNSSKNQLHHLFGYYLVMVNVPDEFFF